MARHGNLHVGRSKDKNVCCVQVNEGSLGRLPHPARGGAGREGTGEAGRACVVWHLMNRVWNVHWSSTGREVARVAWSPL